jgi:hypothetical protein
MFVHKLETHDSMLDTNGGKMGGLMPGVGREIKIQGKNIKKADRIKDDSSCCPKDRPCILF